MIRIDCLIICFHFVEWLVSFFCQHVLCYFIDYINYTSALQLLIMKVKCYPAINESLWLLETHNSLNGKIFNAWQIGDGKESKADEMLPRICLRIYLKERKEIHLVRWFKVKLPGGIFNVTYQIFKFGLMIIRARSCTLSLSGISPCLLYIIF